MNRARESMRSVTILGSTGSIGRSTIDLLLREPQRFAVVALTAQSNVALLAEQARQLHARCAVIGDESLLPELRQRLAGSGIETAGGTAAIIEAATRPAEWVMAAIVGAAGLEPTLAAVQRGAVVALANKEALVCAGAVVMRAAALHGATILPVDSEHNAIFQVFDFDAPETIDRVILTASGGPFRTLSLGEMREVTPAQAMAHPVWSMGAKISVDSATLMNKGLELIEASFLSRSGGSDRGVDPPPVGHSQSGVLCGWFRAGSAGYAGHADPHCRNFGMARPDGQSRGPAGSCRHCPPHLRSA